MPISSRKALAILAYLGLAPVSSASRDKLADLLWSDRGAEQARNSLRQTLTVLRQELGDDRDLLCANREQVKLDQNRLAHEAQDFLGSMALGTTEGLQAAVDLYRGPFLDGFFAGSAEFEDWARVERERFLALAVDALDQLARRSGPSRAGLDHASRLLALDPTREASYRLAMELNADAGHRDKALRLYETCRETMSRLFGVQPSPETVALRARIASAVSLTTLPDNPLPRSQAAPDSSPERVPSVCVLNFADLTPGAEAEALPRGLAHEVVHALLRQPGVEVLAESLNGAVGTTGGQARYVLSGSVQTAGERVRVNVQLIDLTLGTHVWAERYDSAAEDALDFQDRAAQSIALATRHALLQARWNTRDRGPDDDPEVRLLIRRAMVKYFEFSQTSLAAAIKLAERALQLDPGSARAMRVLSLCLTAGVAQGALRASEETTKRALLLAERAVAAVPDDERGRCILSWALANMGRSVQAVAELKHAIALNPDYPTPYSDLAEQYAILGRVEEAVAAAREAIRLGSSVDPVDFWWYYGLACAHFAAGDYAEALENARKVMRMKPGLLRGSLMLAATTAALDEAEEAAAAIARCLELVPVLNLGNVAPGVMPRYAQDEHHARFLAMLRKAGLPE